MSLAAWWPSFDAALMRILGLDPGTKRAGYGLVDLADDMSRPMFLECGTLELRQTERLDRLRSLATDVRELCDEFRPAVMVIELAHVGINVQSCLALAEARGVAMAVAFDRHVNVAQYQPSQAKQAVTGRGNASKEQVCAQLCRTLCIARAPDLNASDALALAVAHAVLGRRSS